MKLIIPTIQEARVVMPETAQGVAVIMPSSADAGVVIPASIQDAALSMMNVQEVKLSTRYSEFVCPIITGVDEVPSLTTCELTVNTDIDSYQRVKYYKSGEPGNVITTDWTDAKSTAGIIDLTGLQSEYTLYYYKAQACPDADDNCQCNWYPPSSWESFRTTCSELILLIGMYVTVGMFGEARFHFTTTNPIKTKHRWRTYSPLGEWNTESDWESSYNTNHNVVSSPLMIPVLGKVYNVQFKAQNQCGYETGWDYNYIIYYFYGSWVMVEF